MNSFVCNRGEKRKLEQQECDITEGPEVTQKWSRWLKKHMNVSVTFNYLMTPAYAPEIHQSYKAK